MPTTWDDTVDSPSLFDQCPSFIGGQFSYAKPRELQPNQASLLQDCEVAITGAAQSRYGTLQIGGNPRIGGLQGSAVLGLTYFRTPTFAYEVAATDVDFYSFDGTNWNPLGVSTARHPSPSAPTEMTQGVDQLYVCDSQYTYAWNGTGLTWTQLSDTIAPPAPGVYSTNKAPVGAKLCVWFTSRLIVGGDTIQDESGGVVSDAIYLSNSLDATTWDDIAHGGAATKAGAQIRVGSGDGSPNIAIVPWQNYNVAVFKRKKIYVVTADPTLAIANMPVQLVHNTIGCVATRTAIQVGADIFFLADDGIRSLSSAIASDQRHEVGIPLSFPVNDIIHRINWPFAQSAVAILWKNLYMISLPLDSAISPNYVLIYNINTQVWNGIWTNMPVSSFAVRLVNGESHLMMGHSSMPIVMEYLDYIKDENLDDSTFTDWDGSLVTPRVTTRAMTFQEPVSLKLGLGSEFEWNNSKGNASVVTITDSKQQLPVTFNVGTPGLFFPITFPITMPAGGFTRPNHDLMQYGEFRELQYDITTLYGGRKELRQVTSAAIVRPSLVGFGDNTLRAIEQPPPLPQPEPQLGGNLIFAGPTTQLSYGPVYLNTWYTIDLAYIVTPGGVTASGKVNGVSVGSWAEQSFSSTYVNAGANPVLTGATLNNQGIDWIKIGTGGYGTNDIMDYDFSAAIVPPFAGVTGTGISIINGVLTAQNGGPAAYAYTSLTSNGATTCYVQAKVIIYDNLSESGIIAIGVGGVLIGAGIFVRWQPANPNLQ